MRLLLAGLVLSAALARCVSAVEPVPKSGFVDVRRGPVHAIEVSFAAPDDELATR